MKGAIIESLVVWGAVAISLLSFSPTEASTETVNEVKISTGHTDSLPLKRDTINLDSLVLDTKATIKLFNKSEIEKLASNKKEVSLLKSSLALDKQQTAITREIIAKLKKKIKESYNKEMVLQMDSVCVETNSNINRIFNGKKCRKYDVTYYVVLNNKRYNLNKD